MTRDEIIGQHTPNCEYPSCYHESDIDQMMDQYYNQAIDEAIEVCGFHKLGYEVVEKIIAKLQALKKEQ